MSSGDAEDVEMEDGTHAIDEDLRFILRQIGAQGIENAVRQSDLAGAKSSLSSDVIEDLLRDHRAGSNHN